MSHLKLVLDEDETLKVEALKKEYGIKQTSELVRFLISHCFKQISKKEE